jgi:hypothetical protein
VGFVVDKMALGQVFLEYLGLPFHFLIQPTALNSLVALSSISIPTASLNNKWKREDNFTVTEE